MNVRWRKRGAEQLQFTDSKRHILFIISYSPECAGSFFGPVRTMIRKNKKRQKRDQLATHSDHSTSGQSGIRHLRLSAAAEKTEQNTADGREAP